jgi:hypothetical protein
MSTQQAYPFQGSYADLSAGWQVHQKNTRKTCGVEGCNAPRAGMSRYCRVHKYRKIRHGHPLQQPISPEDFEDERREAVVAIFSLGAQKNYRDHFEAKWQEVLRWAAALIEEDKAGRATVKSQRKAAYWMQALAQKLSDPRKIIGPIVGCMLAIKRRPGLIQDELALKVQVGRVVLNLIGAHSNPADYEGITNIRPLLHETTAIGDALLQFFLPSVYQLDKVLMKQRAISDPKVAFGGQEQ